MFKYNRITEEAIMTEELFFPGDRVEIIGASWGAEGAIGGIGVVVSEDTPSSSGCLEKGDSFLFASAISNGYKIQIGKNIWNLGAKGKLKLLPKNREEYEQLLANKEAGMAE